MQQNQVIWGSGVTGLTSGLATFPLCNQEPLVVKHKTGRYELGVNYFFSVQCFTHTVGWVTGTAFGRCWFVGGDNLTGALQHVL